MDTYTLWFFCKLRFPRFSIFEQKCDIWFSVQPLKIQVQSTLFFFFPYLSKHRKWSKKTRSASSLLCNFPRKKKHNPQILVKSTCVLKHLLPNPTDTEMHENRKSKGCFQCPRLSLAESSSTLISSGFSMVVDCFFRVLPMTALRSLPISLSSITMVCCYCFVVFVFVPRVFSGNRELSWRVTSLLKLPHCLSSLRFKLSLRLEKQEELLSACAARAYLMGTAKGE